MKTILFLVASGLAFGLGASVPADGITPQQFILQITAATGACTLEVSESATYAPLIPDVDPGLHASSNLDTSRPDTLTWADGTRLVTIGHRFDDRSLATTALYYWRVSGCSGTVSGTVTTGNLGNGTTRSMAAPFNAAKWGNLDYPQFDWLTKKTYVDPTTGVKLHPLKLTQSTWRTGGGSSGPTAAYLTFLDYAGGAGWTNPASALTGFSSAASTSNTNPLDLFVDIAPENLAAYSPTRFLSDVALVLWSGGSSATSGDRTFAVGLIKHTFTSCGGFNIVAPQTGGTPPGVSRLLSGSMDPDAPYPVTFPKENFGSWSTAPCIANEDLPTSGALIVSGSTLTIPNPTSSNHFSSALATGDRVYIEQTSCANNLCTVATNSGPGSITVAESPGNSSVIVINSASATNPMVLTLTSAAPAYLHNGGYIMISGTTGAGCNGGPVNMNGLQQVQTVSGSTVTLYINGTGCTYGANSGTATSLNPYRAYGFWIRLVKTSATGTLAIGVKYKLAGSITPSGATAGGDKCQKISVMSGDGKLGYPCQITSNSSGYSTLYFIANDGTARLFYDYNGAPANGGVGFDPSLANVFYRDSINGGGGHSLQKLTYAGDYTEDIDYAYGCASSGTCPILDEHMTVTDLMPFGTSSDLGQQITALQGVTLPAYNTSLYGDWTAANGNIAFYGITGHFGIYGNLYSGQGQAGSGGPGWLAVVDFNMTPATVVKLIHTLDGTGCPNCRFGSLHSAQPQDSRADTLFLSLDPLTTNNSAVLNGGPYQSVPSGVLLPDGVTWNAADTSLPWPPDSSYYRTCPGGTVTYTECVTLRMKLPCGVAPTTAEKAAAVCPWNPAYSQPVVMAVGDNTGDLMGDLGGGFDNEHFRVLAITLISGTDYKVVFARNSVWDYCSRTPWHGVANTLAVQSDSQARHSNGWTVTMAPGHRGTVSASCITAAVLMDLTSGTALELGHSLAGHFHLGPGATSGNVNFVTAASSAYNQTFAALDQIPPVLSFTDAKFAGNPSGIGGGGGPQSYTDQSQYGAGPANFVWALDFNPLVGCGAEAFGCGPLRTFTALGANIYRVQINGTASATETNYKIQGLIGRAGRYELLDVSAPIIPPTALDATPYSKCFVVAAGQCHAGSVAGEAYVNVPHAFDDANGNCQPSQTWANNVCLFMGFNAPAGFIRQFQISASDPDGRYSRAISMGLSSPGRHYAYTHATMHPSGNLIIALASQPLGGHAPISWLIELPPWAPDTTVRNDFVQIVNAIPAGTQYARIRFGYDTTLRCSEYDDPCVTDRTTAPYVFLNTDSKAPHNACTSGCSILIPALAARMLYYRIERSSDGVTFDATADIHALGVAPVTVSGPPPTGHVTVTGKPAITGRLGIP